MFSHAVKMMMMMVSVTRDFLFYFFFKGNYINNFVLIICRLYHFSCSFSLSLIADVGPDSASAGEFVRFFALMERRALVNFVDNRDTLSICFRK